MALLRSLRLPNWATLTLLFLAALLIRLYRLDAQSLWLDEGSTWQTIGQDWLTLLTELCNPVAAYPLYHLLLKLWVVVAGDSEWALRFPSALSGAAAVVALALAGHELGGRSHGFAAPLMLIASPFAIWYAQEAKVYSLLLFISALLLWATLRALRLRTRNAWLLCAGLGLLSIFIHRLALLNVLAVGACFLLALGERSPTQVRRAAILLALLGAGLVGAMAFGLGSDHAATGAYIPADPLTALQLTFVRFALDRGPGDVAWWWLLPWGALALWGVATLITQARNNQALLALTCFLVIPVGIYTVQLIFTRLFETRYLLLVYPAWLLLLSLPGRSAAFRRWKGIPPESGTTLLAATVILSCAALWQPRLGLFSGDPVKEQYREAIQTLAQHLQPDDLVVVHPAYMRPLYTYYMRRFSSDPAPTPVGFGAFKQGQVEFSQRDWDTQRRAAFSGKLRSLLLIAPSHAATVDVPKAGDEYGLVGLFFQYTREQNAWPCGIWRWNGVHMLCQASPEAYYTGEIPQPATKTSVSFGDTFTLLGYTLKPTSAAGPGVYRAGGNVPITLFWDVRTQPTTDYSLFLHLCQVCDQPPVASDDGPPLAGYLPTSSWLPGKPARDDRAIQLPRDLAPGRYTLLLGLYNPGDPSPNARLTVRGPQAVEGNRLVVTTIEVVAP